MFEVSYCEWPMEDEYKLDWRIGTLGKVQKFQASNEGDGMCFPKSYKINFFCGEEGQFMVEMVVF